MDAQSEAPIKVLIADDHPLMIAGVRRVLERSDNIEIAGEAHSGPELIRLIERRRPQVVLTDLRMPGANGTECIEEIRTKFPEVRVVVLSACEDRPSIDGALNAGASAYVIKSINATDIAAVLREAASGNVFHASSSPGPKGDNGKDEPALPELTEREQAILEAVAAGKTTAVISGELWISEHTVKFHLTNIYRKLGVSNRAGAVRYALQNGLVAAVA